MVNLELLLVGTAHFDLNGARKLNKLLRNLEPDVVAVELDQEGAEEIERAEPMLDKLANASPELLEYLSAEFGVNINPETFRRYLPTTGFEYLTARDFCRERNRKLILADNAIGKIDDHFMSKFKEILTYPPEKLATLIEEGYSSPKCPLELLELCKMRERDFETAKILRNQDGKVAYIGGVSHFYGNYHPNLYELLKDINPQRMRLCEVE